MLKHNFLLEITRQFHLSICLKYFAASTFKETNIVFIWPFELKFRKMSTKGTLL